jgi:hypothetical protein
MALGLALVGIFAFAALVVLTAFAPELTSGDNGGEHALSHSGLGYAGVVQLLKDSGEPVLVSRGRSNSTAGEGLLVLTPGRETDPAELKHFAFSGPTLIVLPKWQAGPDPKRRSWVTRGGPLSAADLAGAFLTQFGAGSAVTQTPGTVRVQLTGAGEPFAGRTLQAGPVELLQTVSGRGWVPLLTDSQGRAVLLWLKDSHFYLLTDPDLLNTHGMKDIATAQTAVTLLTSLRKSDAPIVFDVTLHGLKRERSLLRLILAPPYLGMTLILAFAIALMGLHAVARFGPPQRAARALAFGKQGLADNTAALVRMAGREHRMAAPYAALTRQAVARALAAPRDMDEAQLDAFLDRLGQKRGLAHRWNDLIARAGRARNVSELTAVARDLFHFRQEMTREP